MAASCVFCGRPVDDADVVAGRPPNVAHAACADAALADDAHWDAVAAASGDEPAAEPEPSRDTGAAPRRTGCLTLACLLAALTTAVGLALVGRTRTPARNEEGPGRSRGPWLRRR